MKKLIVILVALGLVSSCAWLERRIGDEPTLEEKCAGTWYRTIHKDECATLNEPVDTPDEPVDTPDEPVDEPEGKDKGKKDK